MTVEELIHELQTLPKDAQQKPVVLMHQVGSEDMEGDVDTVDYDLRVVTLR